MEYTKKEIQTEYISRVLTEVDILCSQESIGIEISKLSEDAILRILFYGLNNPVIAKAMAISPFITFKHYLFALHGSSSMKGLFARIYRKKHFDFDSEITKAIHNENPLIRAEAITNTDSSDDDLLFAIFDENFGVKRNAINHPNIKPEHISLAMLDSCPFVRMEAISNENASLESLILALADENKFVRLQAIMNPNMTNDILEKYGHNS